MTSLKISLLYLVCLCLAVFSSLARSAELAPFEAHYTVSNDQFSVANTTLTFNRQDLDWLLTLTTKPTGIFKVLSRGDSRETSLVATSISESDQTVQLSNVRYTFFQERAKPGRNLSAEFSSTSGRIAVVVDSSTETTIETDHDVYDPVSSMLYVIRQLMTDCSPTQFELSIFSRGKIKRWMFVFAAAEKIKTPVGDYSARRVIRKSSGGKRETHVWYAEALGFVPIKLEQYKRGELVARLTLESLTR